MTTNFKDPGCEPVLKGAKRGPLKLNPNLRQEDEECYAEGSYEAKLDYDLQESEAKIKELDKQYESVLSETSRTEKSVSTPKRLTDKLIGKIQVDINGVTFEDPSSKNRLSKAAGIYPVVASGNSDGSESSGNSGNPGSSEGSESTGESGSSGSPDNYQEALKSLGVKTQRHPNTIRKYTAALTSFFSNLETEYVTEDGHIFTQKLPVIYATREKLISIEEHEFAALANGNTNYLPRASFIIDSLQYDPTRQTNKSGIVSSVVSTSTLSGNSPYAETQSAPAPYNINARLTIMTRGMNDALMLVEQVASRFDPFYTLEIMDQPGMQETASQVRVKLDGVTFEPPTFDEFSANEVVTEFSFIIYGNLYKLPGKAYLIQNINVNLIGF